MGLLDFLGFGKKEKPNLVSPVARPQAADLYNVPMLRDIAKKRLTTGEGLGYGDDFTDRMSSPGIAQIDANFNERTMPLISSELSKRGVARSAGAGLATDVIGRADQQRNRDIKSMVADFQYLNEMAKKADFGQSLQLAQNLDQQEAGLLSDAAAEGERVRDLTVGRADANNAAMQARQNRTLGALGGLISGGGVGQIGSLLGKLGTGGQSSAMGQFGVPSLTGAMGPKARTIDDENYSWLEAYIQARGGI